MNSLESKDERKEVSDSIHPAMNTITHTLLKDNKDLSNVTLNRKWKGYFLNEEDAPSKRMEVELNKTRIFLITGDNTKIRWVIFKEEIPLYDKFTLINEKI